MTVGVAALLFGALAACGGGGSSNGGADGTAPPPATAPVITTQPAGVAVTEGTAATFSVAVTGSAPLAYQWRRDGVDIPGATQATYTLAATTETDGGAQFSVVVSNSAGSITSSTAILTVKQQVLAPSITVQPQSASAQDGGSATLSVVATGTEPLSYQWVRNGQAIDGATAADYSTPALGLADNGAIYSVIVSNGAGQTASDGATLTVSPVAPTIVAGPAASTAVVAGQSAVFVVRATGSVPIAYQWRHNGAAIAGATSDSYTTPALVISDSGATYTVVVSNAAGSVNSNLATVTVRATAVAPTIATAPQNASVTVGQTATFSASANGTAPLAYQWLRNGSAVVGATAATYTTPATTAIDNGTRYSVRVSNSAGSTESDAALLSVAANTSPLVGRAWAEGQLLETDDLPVIDREAAIDDAGRVMVVYLKSDGTRNVLYATRGTPNGPGTSPTWSTPVPIDVAGGVVLNNMTSSNYSFWLGVSPSGNAVAYWLKTAACDASTYRTSGTCNFWYSARFLAVSATWEPPVAIGAFPDSAGQPLINDRGDIAIRFLGWVRSGTSSYDDRVAVVRRSMGSASFVVDTLNDASLANPWLGLDAGGNLLLAAQATANATTDVVAYRGSVAAGLSQPQTLDTRSSSATLRSFAVGLAGQQLVVWSQDNGTTSSIFAATSSAASGEWTVTDLQEPMNSYSALRTAIDDQGSAYVYDVGNQWRRRWLTARWAPEEAFPAQLNRGDIRCTLARSGDMVCINPDNAGGAWFSYDAGRNVVVQAFSNSTPASYVLGVGTINLGVGYSSPLLSVGGYGFASLLNGFDVLPSPAAPSGDSRNIKNLWGVFLK